MSQTDRAQPFATLADQLAGAPTDLGVVGWPPEPWCEPILDELVRSMLLWEAGVKHAASACKRLREACVDENELRICLPDEIAQMLGPRFPAAELHAERLRLALNEVFSREHAMTLASLGELSKRDARSYLESLPSVPGFVRNRVLLLALGAHAMPIDSRISAALKDLGHDHDAGDLDGVAAQLERAVRATDAAHVYAALEHLATGKRPNPRSRTKNVAAN